MIEPLRDALPPLTRPSRATLLRWGVAPLLALVLLVGFFRTVDVPAVTEVLVGFKGGWLGVAVALMLCMYLVQAHRWGILVRAVVPEITTGTLWSATAICWAGNTLLPMGLGNLLRPWVAARRVSRPFPLLLSTMMVELVIEALAALFIVGAVLLLWVPHGPDDPFAEMGSSVGSSIVVVTMLCTVGLLVLAHSGVQSSIRTRLDTLSYLPHRLHTSVLELLDGMEAVRQPVRLVGVFAWTLVNWLVWWGAIEATFFAFGLDLPWGAGLFVQFAITLTMSIPQGPGFLGMFQWVVDQTLQSWSAPTEHAAAMAIALWGVTFVPITLIGVVEAFKEARSLWPRERRPADRQ